MTCSKFQAVTILAMIAFLSWSSSSVFARVEELYILHSPEPGNYSHFGETVVIDKGMVIVGEPESFVNNTLNAGRVYIHDQSGSYLFNLTAPRPEGNYRFGASIVSKNGTMLIAEILATEEGIQNTGRVHIFRSDGTYETTHVPMNPKYGGNFGDSMDFDSQRIVIGQPGGATTSIYIVDRHEGYVKVLIPPSGDKYTYFGDSVKIENDTIIIGEPEYNTDKYSEVGRIHIFSIEGDPLFTIPHIKPQRIAHLGREFVVYGERLYASDSRNNVLNYSRAGQVHIYNKTGEYIETIIAPSPHENGCFGAHLAVTDGFLVITEPNATEPMIHIFNHEGDHLESFEVSLQIDKINCVDGMSLSSRSDLIAVGFPMISMENHPETGVVKVYHYIEEQEEIPAEEEEMSEEKETDSLNSQDIIAFQTLLVVFVIIIIILYRYYWRK